MKVILKEDVRGTGYEGDIVDVKDGFARHKLIPSNLAVKATDYNIKIQEEKLAEIEKRAKDKRELAGNMAEKLAGLVVKVEAEAGETGTLFGAVTNVELAKLLLEQHDIELDRRDIVIHSPIKSLGTVKVDVKLYRDVVGSFEVEVSRKGESTEESEDEKNKAEQTDENTPVDESIDKTESDEKETPKED